MLHKNKKKDLIKRALTGKQFPIGYHKKTINVNNIKLNFVLEKEYSYLPKDIKKNKIPDGYKIIFNNDFNEYVYRKPVYKVKVYLKWKLLEVFYIDYSKDLTENTYTLTIKEAEDLFKVNLSKLYKMKYTSLSHYIERKPPEFYKKAIDLSKWYDKVEIQRKRSLLRTDLKKAVEEYNSAKEFYPKELEKDNMKAFSKLTSKFSSKKDLYEKTEYVY